MACTSKARSAYWSNAVTNTMAGARSTPTSRSTSKPSSSGICTSRNTRSGVTSRIAAAASRPLKPGREPRPIVPDREVQAAVDTPSADQEPNHGAARRDPVTNRVFDERLEDQIGYLGVERFSLGVHHRFQALPEPDLLDVEVVPQELQFLLQRHLLRTRTIEHPPQEIAEPCQHADGEGILTGTNELADGVQRIEQKVRLELHLERFQPCLGELGFELRGAQLPFS